MTDAPAPTSAPVQPADPGKYQEQIRVWTGYTHDLAMLAGLLQEADNICRRALQAGTFKIVDPLFHAAYDIVRAVNDQLNHGITEMTSGKLPESRFGPSAITNWPATSHGDDTFPAAWETVKAMLEQLMSGHPSSSLVSVVIGGLIGSGDAISQTLQRAFD